MLVFNGNGQRIREPAVAGTFYPSNVVELKKQLGSFMNSSDENQYNKNIAALIVPHAGYVFSGNVAASAYKQLDPEKKYSTVFLIGTSHRVRLDGCSVYETGSFKTPFGNVDIDTETAKRLIRTNSIFKSLPEVHQKEHSLEVQLPFLQYHLKKPFKIVPVLIGTESTEKCKSIARSLKPYFTEKNLFVISSDFSHYPEYNDAIETDKKTGESITQNSPEKFLDGLSEISKKRIRGLSTSCCGWSSVYTLLNITFDLPNIQIQHVAYQNSGDSQYGDKERVVGYHSFLVLNDKKENEFKLSSIESKFLLELARNSIICRLNSIKPDEPEKSKLTDALKLSCGAFVTLYNKGVLRGCIGRLKTTNPLYKTIQEMAISAAFNDIRFDQLQYSELENLEIEISVLSPLKKIKNIEEIIPGKHGIYMVKGNQSGTFLPKVAAKMGWNCEELLGHCARDKAGIGWFGWKQSELFVYESYVISSK